MVSNNMIDKIVINEDLLSKNDLEITNLKCEDDNTNLTGSITSNNLNFDKTAVIGAYIIKNNEIIQVSATAFIVRNYKTLFNLKFDVEDFDQIVLYADILENNKDNLNNIVSVETRNHSKKDYGELNSLDRVKSVIEVDEDSFSSAGLKLENISLAHKYTNVEFTIFAELHKIGSYKNWLTLTYVIYDEYNNILDSEGMTVDTENIRGFDIIEWDIEVEPSQIDRIWVYLS